MANYVSFCSYACIHLIKIELSFQSTDSYQETHCFISGARFGKQRFQQMDDSLKENFENSIGYHSYRVCSPRGQNSISVASDIAHPAPYSILRVWDSDNKKQMPLTNSDYIRKNNQSCRNVSNNNATTSSILSSSKSTPSMKLRGGFASPHQPKAPFRVRSCKDIKGSKVIL